MTSRTGRMLLLAGLLAGCGYIHQGLSESNGVLSLDGVPLRWKRWVVLEVPAGTTSLEVSSGTADIALSGSTDGSTRIELQLYSELEGDGSVALENGRIVARSASSRKVAVNGARGTLGPGFALQLENGTGGVSLTGGHELQRVGLVTGTGNILLSATETQGLLIESGTGNVSLRDSRTGDVKVETGTGGVEVAGCSVAALQIETGTADVLLRDCKATRTEVASGTGNVTLQGQNDLGATSWDLGTGQVAGG